MRLIVPSLAWWESSMRSMVPLYHGGPVVRASLSLSLPWWAGSTRLVMFLPWWAGSTRLVVFYHGEPVVRASLCLSLDTRVVYTHGIPSLDTRVVYTQGVHLLVYPGGIAWYTPYGGEVSAQSVSHLKEERCLRRGVSLLLRV